MGTGSTGTPGTHQGKELSTEECKEVLGEEQPLPDRHLVVHFPSVRTGMSFGVMSRRGRAAPNMMRCAYCATLAPVHRSSYRASGSTCSSRLESGLAPVEIWGQATWLKSMARRGSLAGSRNVMSLSVHSPRSSPVSSHNNW